MKIKRITRNLKYFVPLLLKISPMTIITMILVALVGAINSLAWVIFPKVIIEELFYEKDYQKLIIIVIIFIITQFFCNVFQNILFSINSYYTRKADFKIDKLFNQKIARMDYFHIEDPKFNDELSYAKKCLSDYSNGIYSVTWTIRWIIEQGITIVGVISIVLLSGEFWIILVAIIGIIINTIIYGKYQKVDEEHNKSIVRFNRLQWYFGQSMLSFRNQKNLRIYDSEKLILSKNEEINNEAFKLEKDTMNKQNKISIFEYGFSYLFTTLSTILLLALSVYIKVQRLRYSQCYIQQLLP